MERNLDLRNRDNNIISKEAIEKCEKMSSPLLIIGIDPGVTTGISCLVVDKDNLPMPEEVEVWGSSQYSYGGSGNRSDVVDGNFVFVSEYSPVNNDVESAIATEISMLITYLRVVAQDNPLNGLAPAIVACEDFIVRRMDSSRDFLSPVRITAALKLAIANESKWLRQDKEGHELYFTLQSPSEAKTVCKDGRMDKWGYEIRTQQDRHSRDADRHAVLLLRRLIENPRKVYERAIKL